MQIPGLTDVHVHLREPGAIHKEDFDSGTAAALAGGITTVLAMPNTQPAIQTENALNLALYAARSKARCDYGQYVGAGPGNAETIATLAPQAAGLKLYLDATFGDLKLDEMHLWRPHLKHWPKDWPIVAHAEMKNLAALLLWAHIYDRTIHIAHVSRKEEILTIRGAKERGIKVTCEVSPHHLFLSTDDIPHLGEGWHEVRPRLATPEDQKALWDNLEVIDCFATDHAPHTSEEKSSATPPPGFPGLETALPLLLTAASEGRLTIEDIVSRMHANPKEIFGLPDQPDTFIEIDLAEKWEIKAEDGFTRCNWTPFEGWKVTGKIKKVVLRGETAFENGTVLAKPGTGRNIRTTS